jgi:hypothetical protein
MIRIQYWFLLVWLGLILACSGIPHIPEEKGIIKPLRSITVDTNAWGAFNWAAFDQDKIVSYGNYQYTVYWDADMVLVVVRRDLGNDEIQKLRLKPYKLTINPNDRHRNIVIGISPGDGRLHMSWDHHNNDLRYTKTRSEFLTNPPDTISEADFESAQPLAPAAPQKVTYPRFLNDNEGRLFFVYRSGGSGNGRTVVSRYDSYEGTWLISSGYLFGSEGLYEVWDSSNSRNAYPHDILFDQNNRLHVTWVFRETGKSWASNHDLHYAYSDDFGLTWKNNLGHPIADLSRKDAIVLHDSAIVVHEIPVYSWVMNTCPMALDSKNQPHVVLYKLPGTFKPDKLEHGPPEAVSKQLRFFHYWRDVEGNWHNTGPLQMPENLTIKRPDMIITPDDTIVFTWASNNGFRSFIAGADNQWQSWKLIKLTGPEYTSNNACKHDRRLLKEKGLLSFTADPRGEKEGSGYAILDFEIKDLILLPGN